MLKLKFSMIACRDCPSVPALESAEGRNCLRRRLHGTLGPLFFGLTIAGATMQAANLTLVWNPSADSSVVGYNVYYWNPSDVLFSADMTNVNGRFNTNVTVTGLSVGSNYVFAATTYDSHGMESRLSSELAYTGPPPATNGPPTLNPVGNLTLNENSGPLTVNLSGITSGLLNLILPITLTATSSNPSVIPNPTVVYTSPNSTGQLVLTPAANASGSAIITVTVNNGQLLYNLFKQTFTVNVSYWPTASVRVTPQKKYILTLTALAGHTNSILASTNLKTWSVIYTATMGTGGHLSFTDATAPSYPARFYRIRDTH